MLSRQIMESDIWNKPPEYLKIFLYILLKVNHEDKYHPRGSNFFNFSQQLPSGVTKNQVYDFLRWAKSKNVNILTTRKTTRGIVVKVNNYNKFQTPENYELQDKFQDSSKTAPRQLQDNSNTINKNERIKNKEYFYKKEKNFLKSYLPILGDFDFG